MKTPRQRIKEAVQQDGPYSHNIIGLALNRLAKEEGDEAVIEVFDQYALEDMGFVRPKKTGTEA